MASETSENATSHGNTSNFTIKVSNLPKDLEKDSVRGIFSEFGQVTGCILVPCKNDTNQAFISYAKYNEAEKAINELNGQPPFMLRIEFRDKDLKSLHKIPNIDLSGPIVDHRYKECDLDQCTDIKKSIGMGKPNCTPAFRPNTYSSDSDVMYPYPSDDFTFNPYDAPGPYYDTNLMYTRGITHVSKDGRRHISFGRGFTYYTLPEPHYNVQVCLQKVCEKRENRLYEYVSGEIEDDTGNCKVCSSPTAFTCQQCSVTFYCSRTCQVNDWPKHKIDCQPVPPLMKKIYKKVPQENGQEPQQSQAQTEKSRLRSKEPPSIPAQEQRTATTQSSPTKSVKSNGHYRPSEDESNANANHLKESSNYKKQVPQQQSAPHQNISPQKQYISPQKQSSTPPRQQNQRPQQNQQSFSRPQNQQTEQQQRPPQNKPPQGQQNQQRKARTSEDNIVFQTSNEFIPRDKFVDVLIRRTIGSGEYLVLKIDSIGEAKEFCQKLTDHAAKAQFVPPEQNIRCVLEHNGTWFRATILSLNENGKSEVYFHDYGETDHVKVDKVFLDTFDEVPYYARRIRLLENTDEALKNLTINQCLSVRATMYHDDGHISVVAQACKKEVEDNVRDELVGVNSASSQTDDEIFLEKLAGMNNIIKTLKPDDEGLVVIHAAIGQDEYNLTVVPNSKLEEYAMLFDDLKNACEAQLTKNPKFIPKVGEMICGKTYEHDEWWFRGIVSAVKPQVKLAVTDECRFIIPDVCTPLPAGFDKLESLGVVCQFSSEYFETGSFKVLEVLEKSKDSIKVWLKSDNGKITGNGQFKMWIPKSEEKGISKPTLSSGNTVTMLHFVSPCIVYVRIQETKEKERVFRLEQEVASYALDCKPLDQKPVVGEMVLAYYTNDENYYRAIVTKIEDEKIMIKYVDYGNDETKITTKDLYKLPDKLKEQPAGCIKIKLKGLTPDIPFNIPATEYYQTLVDHQVQMTCTFDGSPLEDGVILKTQNNEIVNDSMKTLLQPTWEQDKPAEDNILTLCHLPSMKLGDVGDDIKAIVLCTYPSKGMIVLGPDDETAAQAVYMELGQKIAQYVKTKTDHYIPRENELCIALYEGEYFRALCLESSCSPDESRIFFVDYGNTERVKHQDIREMSVDLIELGAFGTLCNIKDALPKYDEDIQARINTLINVHDTIEFKIINKDEADMIIIDIPHLRVKLTEENLL